MRLSQWLISDICEWLIKTFYSQILQEMFELKVFDQINVEEEI